MANIFPTRVVCKKTRENISELSYVLPLANEIEIFSKCFRFRISNNKAIMCGPVFHYYSIIHFASQIRTLSASFQAFFYGYYARVVLVVSSIYY